MTPEKRGWGAQSISNSPPSTATGSVCGGRSSPGKHKLVRQEGLPAKLGGSGYSCELPTGSLPPGPEGGDRQMRQAPPVC